MPDAYIAAALRTAGARRGGALAGWHPVDLLAQLMAALLERSGADPAAVDDVIVGCVGQAGEQSTNVARNAVLAAGWPETVPATTVDRQCGSSQQALHFAAQAVMAGTADLVVAAGVESMSRVPMGLPHALPAKHGLGRYFSPRLAARYPNSGEFSQFTGAALVAERYGLDRAALDAYALQSHRRAAAATEAGAFADEILPLPVWRAGEAAPSAGALHARDEGIRFDASAESIAAVKPLAEGGVLSAAHASQLCDGAAGLLVASERALKTLKLAPLARVRHLEVMGDDPVAMLLAPIPATQRALRRAGLALADIDLFEVNEAFAPVPLAWLKALGADPARLNVHGGAIALGHPLGASGAKLMATLVRALHRHGGRLGLLTMCEGGGMANVTIVERC
jgi:acetyl-CoA C-acetyltransferase